MDDLRTDLHRKAMYLIDILSAACSEAEVVQSWLSLIESFVSSLIGSTRYADAGPSTDAVQTVWRIINKSQAHPGKQPPVERDGFTQVGDGQLNVRYPVYLRHR